MADTQMDQFVAALIERIDAAQLKADSNQLGSTHIVRQQIHHARQLVEALAYGAEDADTETPVEKGAI